VNFFKQYWLKIGIFCLLILPVVSFTLVSLSILIMIYWPTSFNRITLDQFQTQKTHLVILAHGVRDNTEGWSKPLKNTLKNTEFDGDVVDLDWSAYANKSMTCAVQGKRIGHLIGKKIAQNNNLKSVHLIAHSCGSFVIYGACEAIRHADKTNSIQIQTTYLDPVSVYGILWNYGVDNFGSCGDYSEAYIDTEDSVPGSNQLLPFTHTYDVTAVRHRSNSDIPPHLWPVAYYHQLVRDGLAPDLHTNATLPSQKPVGELDVVF